MRNVVSNWIKDKFTKEHKARFFGKVTKKRYSISYSNTINTTYETIRREEFYLTKTKETFQEGQEVYIDVIDRFTTVTDVAKETNGDYVYKVTYVLHCDENLEEYERVKAELELKLAKKEQEKIEYQTRKKHEQDEFSLLMKNKRENPNIKVTFLKANIGQSEVDMDLMLEIHREINKALPDNQMVIVSPFEVTIGNN